MNSVGSNWLAGIGRRRQAGPNGCVRQVYGPAVNDFSDHAMAERGAESGEAILLLTVISSTLSHPVAAQ